MDFRKVCAVSLLLSFSAIAFADNCPGTDKGVFNFDGTYPAGWENSTKEDIAKGEHNFLQVTWKPTSGSTTMGTVYCTYSGNLVLANKEGSTPTPTNANWKASSIPGAFNCIKGTKDCEFTASSENETESSE